MRSAFKGARMGAGESEYRPSLRAESRAIRLNLTRMPAERPPTGEGKSATPWRAVNLDVRTR